MRDQANVSGACKLQGHEASGDLEPPAEHDASMRRKTFFLQHEDVQLPKKEKMAVDNTGDSTRWGVMREPVSFVPRPLVVGGPPPSLSMLPFAF